MPKLMRAFVLGAMLAVLSSATAAVAPAPLTRPSAVPVGERPTGPARQHGRPAGRRAASSTAQPARETGGSTLAQARRAYYESTRVHPAAPSAQPADRGTPVTLLAALAAAAVLALSLDALSVRRKTRKSAAHPRHLTTHPPTRWGCRAHPAAPSPCSSGAAPPSAVELLADGRQRRRVELGERPEGVQPPRAGQDLGQ